MHGSVEVPQGVGVAHGDEDGAVKVRAGLDGRECDRDGFRAGCRGGGYGRAELDGGGVDGVERNVEREEGDVWGERREGIRGGRRRRRRWWWAEVFHALGDVGGVVGGRDEPDGEGGGRGHSEVGGNRSWRRYSQVVTATD